MLCDYNTEKQLGLKWVLVKNVRQSPNRAEIIFGLTRKPSPCPSCGCQDNCASHNNTCTVDLSPVTAKKGQGKCLVLFVDTMEKRFLIFPQRERQVLKINQILRNHLPIL
jgi:hypothetical protein